MSSCNLMPITLNSRLLLISFTLLLGFATKQVSAQDEPVLPAPRLMDNQHVTPVNVREPISTGSVRASSKIVIPKPTRADIVRSKNVFVEVTPSVIQNNAEIGLLFNSKRYEDALTVLDTLLKREPKNARFWFNHGVARQALADYAGALTDYEIAAWLNPLDNSAKGAASKILSYVGPVSSTIKNRLNQYSSALLAQSPSPQSTVSKLLKNAQYPEALAMLQEELMSFPTSDTTWKEIGMCRLGSGDVVGSLGFFEMSRRLERRGLDSTLVQKIIDEIHGSR